MRRLIAERKRWRAFGHGTIEFLQPKNAKILAFVREAGEESVLVVANLSRFTQAAELDLSAYAGLVPMEIFSRSKFMEIRPGGTLFTLGPHVFYWLALRRKGTVRKGDDAAAIPVIEQAIDWSGPVKIELRELLERELLPVYFENCRWFPGRNRQLRELKITENFGIQPERSSARFLLVHAAFAEGLPETYILPLQCSSGELGSRILAEAPQAVVARFNGGAEEQVLHDAIYDGNFRAILLESFARTGWITGRLRARQGRFLDAAEIQRVAADSKVIAVGGSNSTVSYGGVYFLKLYRRLEWGKQPEEELARYLTETREFPATPRYVGGLQYTSSLGGPVATIALLFNFVQNQGDGWSYTVDALGRYFERVLADRPQLDDPAAVVDVIGAIHPERVRQLGQRLGEFHLAVGADPDDAAFAPEPFTHALPALALPGLARAVAPDDPLTQPIGHGIAGGGARRCGGNLERGGHAPGALWRPFTPPPERFENRDPRGFSPRPGAQHRQGYRDHRSRGRSFAAAQRTLPETVAPARCREHVALLRLRGQFRARAATARGREFLGPWAKIWTKHLSEQFVFAYREATHGAAFLPDNEEDFQLLMDVYVLDRTVAEINNELNYRPEMAAIPIRALRDLIGRTK